MMLRWKPLLCLVQSFLMLISLLSPYDSAFKRNTDRKAVSLTAQQDISFSAAAAQSFEVSAKEKQACRDWFNAHIRTDHDPAYDFTVGLCSFRSHLSDWTITVGKESECGAVYRNGKTSIIKLQHKKSGLIAEVEATIYEDYASCEWTVLIRNTADRNSPVIRRFYAADCTLNTGKTTLYVSKGSNSECDDFELMKTDVNRLPMVFNANGGRSVSFLPYMNLSGSETGAVLAVGWTGQWYTSFRQTLCGVHLRAKQEFFKAYLKSGESVRSPLVSLTFYHGDNALKGFELFRRMELDCVYPACAQPTRSYIFADEFSTLSSEQLIAELQQIDKKMLDQVDCFWMDAGWYAYNEYWADGVGNWVPDAKRFPNGLKPLADEIKKRGKHFLLWYEPERVREGTFLFREGAKREDWIIQIDNDYLWNLANDDACAFLAEYIAASLAENGVTIYRQDFNFNPLNYWKKADKSYASGRKGISENHYVTNLYRFLDTLCARVDGLMIDNCASGGRRLDLEMTRRSVPFWRSDYNCRGAEGELKTDILEATQAMTYGLSFWLPFSGTNPFSNSEYAMRSVILTHPSFASPYPERAKDYDSVRQFLTENYYPLTYGGADQSRLLAMQFGSDSAGAALIYRREQVASSKYLLHFNGLNPSKEYTLTDFDDMAFNYTVTGEELMQTGVTLQLRQGPSATIILYEQKQ